VYKTLRLVIPRITRTNPPLFLPRLPMVPLFHLTTFLLHLLRRPKATQHKMIYLELPIPPLLSAILLMHTQHPRSLRRIPPPARLRLPPRQLPKAMNKSRMMLIPLWRIMLMRLQRLHYHPLRSRKPRLTARRRLPRRLRLTTPPTPTLFSSTPTGCPRRR